MVGRPPISRKIVQLLMGVFRFIALQLEMVCIVCTYTRMTSLWRTKKPSLEKLNRTHSYVSAFHDFLGMVRVLQDLCHDELLTIA